MTKLGIRLLTKLGIRLPRGSSGAKFRQGIRGVRGAPLAPCGGRGCGVRLFTPVREDTPKQLVLHRAKHQILAQVRFAEQLGEDGAARARACLRERRAGDEYLGAQHEPWASRAREHGAACATAISGQCKLTHEIDPI